MLWVLPGWPPATGSADPHDLASHSWKFGPHNIKLRAAVKLGLIAMPMRPTLFTLSGAATELGRDVRMLGMALKATPPDGQVRGRDGWFLSTIINAIERRSRATGSRSGNSICDECERLGHELEDGLQKLRDEPDLAKRRAIVKEIGWLVAFTKGR